MTRIELIESDEYVETYVDLLVRSNVGIRVIRRDLKVRWIEHKDELKEAYEKLANLKCIEVLEAAIKTGDTYNYAKEKLSELKSQPIVIDKDDLKIVPSVGGGYSLDK